MQAFMGMIQAFGFNYPPVNWSFCSGGLLPISQYGALYSLLGTFYGGNGQSTFALPDLRARTPVGSTIMGTSPTVPQAIYPLGYIGGQDKTSLNVSNLANHSHAALFTPTGPGSAAQVDVSQNSGNAKTAQLGDYIASAPALGTTFDLYVDDANKGTTVALGGVSGGGSGGGTVVISNSGAGHSFYILNPFTAITYSLAMDGIYPSRN